MLLLVVVCTLSHLPSAHCRDWDFLSDNDQFRLVQLYTMYPLIGYVNKYPTMHYFGNPGHTQSMIAYIMIFTNYSDRLRCGNVVNIPIVNFRTSTH